MRRDEPGTLLGGLTPKSFLKRYWQKRPLLVRGAFPGFQDPLGAEELAGLACEDGVESRLVLVRGGRRPFHVVPGPQDERRLRRLPATHWTLLVQGVDRQVSAVARLRDRFRFVPDWRIDDVMVSFASPFGSVGPHLDSYDVFLLQGRGRRRWRVQLRPDPALRAGLDLRVLRRFEADGDWVLEAGDMLYVPPGIAHHGVALEDSLTYSIGFRAPSHAELLAGALQRRLRRMPASLRYADPGLGPTRQPGEIDRTTIARLRRIVARELAGLVGPDLERAFGELLTEAKDAGPLRRPRRLSPAALGRRIVNGGALVRSDASRIAFVRRRGGTDLFVDGQTLALSRPLAFAAPLLTGPPRLDGLALRPHLEAPGFLELVADLVNRGAFELARR
jgi:50S ribosomal protein L16 3-hydroxylase